MPGLSAVGVPGVKWPCVNQGGGVPARRDRLERGSPGGSPARNRARGFKAERSFKRRTRTVAKLKDKVAVITGATSGMALATARLFVEEGAYVFITGRRQK